MRKIIHNPKEVMIEFSKEEMIDLWDVATIRQAPKEGNAFAEDKRRKMIPNVEMHFIGILGEYAFAKYSGLPFDRNGYLSGDKKKDFLLDGRTIEIKTLQGYLAFDVQYFHKEFCADLAVLAIYKKNYDKKILPYVLLEGWITRQQFTEIMFVDDFGYGPRYCIQPVDLLPMEELLSFEIITKAIPVQMVMPL